MNLEKVVNKNVWWYQAFGASSLRKTFETSGTSLIIKKKFGFISTISFFFKGFWLIHLFYFLFQILRATSRKLGLSCSKNSTQTGDELLHILNRYDTLIHHCAKNEIQSSVLKQTHSQMTRLFREFIWHRTKITMVSRNLQKIDQQSIFSPSTLGCLRLGCRRCTGRRSTEVPVLCSRYRALVPHVVQSRSVPYRRNRCLCTTCTAPVSACYVSWRPHQCHAPFK